MAQKLNKDQYGTKLNKYIDANGWSVYDYGEWREWKKSVGFNPPSMGSHGGTSLGTVELPVGISDLTNYHFNLSYGVSHREILITQSNDYNSTNLNFMAFNASNATIDPSWVEVGITITDE